MTKEALKLALEAMEYADACLKKQLTMKYKHEYAQDLLLEAGTAIKDVLAQSEPVAWLITDEKINSLQVDSIQRLIDRARHAHMTDIKLRINGQDEWFQADWLKHLTRTTPPQRTWVGLTDEEILSISADCASSHQHMDIHFARAIEAKLRSKNS